MPPAHGRVAIQHATSLHPHLHAAPHQTHPSLLLPHTHAHIPSSPAGIPGLILFTLGCPVGAALFLWWRRKRHSDPDFLTLYGFLYEEYEPQCFYWVSGGGASGLRI